MLRRPIVKLKNAAQHCPGVRCRRQTKQSGRRLGAWLWYYRRSGRAPGDDKGEWLLYRAHVPGQSAQQLLAGMVSTALSKLPIPKLMRWGDKETQFVRPVHTVTLLLVQN
ncbi:Glycine--tRNA ligase beta subunit [Serratia fonticola]|uniref:Glycine--tRNA ligase beta subunit n=1 Tax=Serratia fonticola TaxID=47917 RepID=A0A4U9WHR1_SERFO|nr:Glycine--tRNA ligase beta subunit [Serratia fonticola]